ncbi:MAG: hypothetical protein K6B65_04310 [Bacilli bacterium]|nr:hypothetical protein [Bacilli bacterium]
MEEKTSIPEVKVHAPDGVKVEVKVEYADSEDKVVEEAPVEEEVIEETPVTEAAPEEAPVEVEAVEEVPVEEEADKETPIDDIDDEGPIVEATPEEMDDDEFTESRIITSPEELEEKIAELEERNAEARAKIDAIEARKTAARRKKVDELYDDFIKAIRNMNESCVTIANSLAGVQDDFTEGVGKINDAYFENQLEKVILKGKEVK